MARKNSNDQSGQNSKAKSNKYKIRLTKLFQKDYDKCPAVVQEDIKATLKSISKEELLNPGQKLKILIKYKNRRIWYFRVGGDTRITAFFDKDGNFYLLSIETHSTLKRAHKRVINTLRSYEK
ncbi:MAG: hypothetical protein DRP46_00410 [Candidatus Zixiibacteriota bacterium]|nr:MAG: hypothetical protein DRP46_00410 [candidate division Zixibacteria bacterium]